MLIKEILVTYEDGSTFTVFPKLAPDVQGTGLADLQPAHEDTTPSASASTETTNNASVEAATSTKTVTATTAAAPIEATIVTEKMVEPLPETTK